MPGIEPRLRRILAANLKKRRHILGMSQEKLAELSALSWQTINSIECRRTWVSDKTLESLAAALKIESYRLLIPQEDAARSLLTPGEALSRLEAIKRAFDDAFHEIITLTRPGSGNG